MSHKCLKEKEKSGTTVDFFGVPFGVFFLRTSQTVNEAVGLGCTSLAQHWSTCSLGNTREAQDSSDP